MLVWIVETMCRLIIKSLCIWTAVAVSVGVISGDKDSSSVFISQPGPNDAIVAWPINSTASFNCAVANSNLIWLIRQPDEDTDLPLVEGFDQEFLALGIFHNTTQISPTIKTSILYVDATVENSQIQVVCSTGIGDSGNRVTLLVYDPPKAPKNIIIADVDEQMVDVSWESQRIPGVELNFTVTVINLNSTQRILVVEEPYFIFTGSHINNLCDVYQFQVVATNGAGSSDASVSEPTMLPSRPRVSSIDESLQHVIMKRDEKISITISFNAAEICTEYPVTHYHVAVSTSPSQQPMVIFTDVSSTGQVVEIEVGPEYGVEENMLYTYLITAANGIGNVSSESKECYTSDVKMVRAETIGEQYLNVKCQFIEGSNAQGCLVVVVSDDKDTENITKMFHRSNNDLIIQDTLDTKLNLSSDCCNQYHLFGFDIEHDNTISDLPVPGEISIGKPTDKAFPLQPKGDVPNSDVLIGTVVASVVVLLLLVLLIIFIITIILRRNTAPQLEQRTITEPEEIKTNSAYAALRSQHLRQMNTNTQTQNSLHEDGKTTQTSASNLPTYEEVELSLGQHRPSESGNSSDAPVIYDRVIPDPDGVMLQGNASYERPMLAMRQNL